MNCEVVEMFSTAMTGGQSGEVTLGTRVGGQHLSASLSVMTRVSRALVKLFNTKLPELRVVIAMNNSTVGI